MYLAIDLGGTKTLVGLFTPDGELKKAVKFPTSPQYETFLSELKQTVTEVAGEETLLSACMAIPGIVDREHGIVKKYGNLDWPLETPIRVDLSTFISCPIFLENDTNLAGLAEARILGDSYRKVLYVSISTGIGSGYVVNGVLDQDTLDAEIGHSMYEHDGELQEWEDFASGSWIVKTYGKRASDLDDPEAWKQIAFNIGLGLVNGVNSYAPDVIVIGGGVGTHLDKFIEPLHDAIKLIDPGFNKIPEILKAQRPEEAVIYGCYELCKQNIS